MSKLNRHISAILLFSVAHIAQAQTVSIIGAGSLSCGAWAQAREQQDVLFQQSATQWVAGFLAAHNFYRANGVKQAEAADLPTITLWLDTYCRANPTHAIFGAAGALVEELGGTKTQYKWIRP